jgi:hypothetical protein
MDLLGHHTSIIVFHGTKFHDVKFRRTIGRLDTGSGASCSLEGKFSLGIEPVTRVELVGSIKLKKYSFYQTSLGTIYNMSDRVISEIQIRTEGSRRVCISEPDKTSPRECFLHELLILSF